MKGELEEAVTELNFPHTIILKPLLLMGKREESRPPEAMLQGIAKGLGMINKRLLTDVSISFVLYFPHWYYESNRKSCLGSHSFS